MPNPYQTLYDVRTEKPPIQNEIRGGIAGAMIGVLLLALVWKRPERAPRIFLLLWIVGWSGFSAWNAMQTVRAQNEAAASFARGDVRIQEGVLTNLVPASAEGSLETFQVGGQAFIVGDGRGSAAGLSQRTRLTSPLENGQQLRVSYRGKAILRVQQAAPAATAPASEVRR
jgi:hypothetical protein